MKIGEVKIRITNQQLLTSMRSLAS